MQSSDPRLLPPYCFPKQCLLNLCLLILIACHLGKPFMWVSLQAQSRDTPHWTQTPLLEPKGSQERKEGFRRIHEKQSGIGFVNQLEGDAFLTDAVAHNGSGVALGDINNDGLDDIYFCGLQSPNELYLNQGNWQFKVMEHGQVDCPDQLSTGAIIVDVDGDHDQDLLVGGIASGVRLFLNDGAGQFRESVDSGLDRNGSPTSMAMADLDRDGDLDLYCAHYIDEMYTADPTTSYGLVRRGGKLEVNRVNGQSTEEPRLRNRFTVSSTGKLRELPEMDQLYLNDGKGHFTSISLQKGTFLSQQGQAVQPPRDWSLAVSFRDFNHDGWPDLYVCSDNATPDRLWINNQLGGFQLADRFAIRHTSRSSMGIDVADVNRDGYDDFLVVDMFARDPARRMQQLVKQTSPPEEVVIPHAQPRYNRNTLFMGALSGYFKEVALMSGVAASDWSWCPIFLDVDLDGDDDLLISNGFSFDVMDQDSHDALKTESLSVAQRKRSRQFHPPFLTPDAAFRNRGDGTFEPADADWGFEQHGVSYGMAMADLDQDGDQDLVINQLNQPAMAFENIAVGSRVKVQLKGLQANHAATGARLTLTSSKGRQSQVIQTGGRYMSSDSPSRTFALSQPEEPTARLQIDWPNGTTSQLSGIKTQHLLTIIQPEQAPLSDLAPAQPDPLLVRLQTLVPTQAKPSALAHKNDNDTFLCLTDLDGGLVAHDINQDGRMDLWLEGSSQHHPRMLLQQVNGSFQDAPLGDQAIQARGKATGWKSQDNQPCWIVSASQISPRGIRSISLYLINQHGLTIESIPTSLRSLSALSVLDLDHDGDLDLVVAGKGAADQSHPSSLMIWLTRAGKLEPLVDPSLVGNWRLGIRALSPLENFRGNQAALLVAGAWGPLNLLFWEDGRLRDLSNSHGLDGITGAWTSLLCGDFDSDGDNDILAGNLGTNTEWSLVGSQRVGVFQLELKPPMKDQILPVAFRDGKWWPIQDLNTLKGMAPEIVARIPSHAAFSRMDLTSFTDFTGAEDPRLFEVQTLFSTVLWNEGGRFATQSLPAEAQTSPIRAMVHGHLGVAREPFIFIGQNVFQGDNPLTRHDAGDGLLMVLKANHLWDCVSADRTGVRLVGEQTGLCFIPASVNRSWQIAVAESSGIVSILGPAGKE